MNISKLILVQAFILSAATAQESLPPKMAGKWSNSSNGQSNSIEVELLNMESPTRANVKIAFWPYCRPSESVAEFKDGAWHFLARRCETRGRDTEIALQLKPVEGKKRLEGVYSDGIGRTAFLEWK